MKKAILLTVVAAVVLSCMLALVACTGGFSVSTYKLEVSAKVENVPNNVQIDDDYVKSIISVNLKWTDDSTTHVNLDDCKITHEVKGDKLEIKVKFGKKSGKISLDIVEASNDGGDDEDKPTLIVDQKEMFVEGMTEEQIMAIIDVAVCVPNVDDAVQLSTDDYMILEINYNENQTIVAIMFYVEAYTIAETQEFELYYNPLLKIEGEENLVPHMTKAEVENTLRVYLEDEQGNKTYVDFTCTLTVDEFDNVDVDIYTLDNGHTHTGFSNRKYYNVSVIFDETQWKENMTDAEIIAAFSYQKPNAEGDFVPYTPDPAVVITIQRESNGTINVLFDDETVAWALYVGYDCAYNPFSD